MIGYLSVVPCSSCVKDNAVLSGVAVVQCWNLVCAWYEGYHSKRLYDFGGRPSVLQSECISLQPQESCAVQQAGIKRRYTACTVIHCHAHTVTHIEDTT